jgi:hypothetical protein
MTMLRSLKTEAAAGWMSAMRSFAEDLFLADLCLSATPSQPVSPQAHLAR